MTIHPADHYGMCFGVRDALRKAHDVASAGPATVLGELVHNAVVQRHLDTLGLQRAHLDRVGSSGTERVIITAHGAADHQLAGWRAAGYEVTDTTCPLVRKAHTALAQLVAGGCQGVVIGQKGHVEVRGLCGDFPGVSVVENAEEVDALPWAARFGVVAQTTQPLVRVQALVARLRERYPASEVIFRDTVCQPTKDRQLAMEKLCGESTVMVVVGGRNSNNTHQLSETARRAGIRVWQVESAEDLQAGWFRPDDRVGVTAGTSTLDETMQAVLARMQQIAASQHKGASAVLAQLSPLVERALRVIA